MDQTDQTNQTDQTLFLCVHSVITMPREQIERRQEFILPAAISVFGPIHTWPNYTTPMLAYDLLIKYHTPRQYNTVALSAALSIPHLVSFDTQPNRIYKTIDTIDNLGFFETECGREELNLLLDASLVPVMLKRRNAFVVLDFVQSPQYRQCIEAIREIARGSFAYDEPGHCITVNDADSRRISGLQAGSGST